MHVALAPSPARWWVEHYTFWRRCDPHPTPCPRGGGVGPAPQRGHSRRGSRAVRTREAGPPAPSGAEGRAAQGRGRRGRLLRRGSGAHLGSRARRWDGACGPGAAEERPGPAGSPARAGPACGPGSGRHVPARTGVHWPRGRPRDAGRCRAGG